MVLILLLAALAAVGLAFTIVMVRTSLARGQAAPTLESAILGVPAIAFSLAAYRKFDFGPAARFARSLVEAALEDLPEQPYVLNVNVPPNLEPGSYSITRLGKHSYGNEVVGWEAVRALLAKRLGQDGQPRLPRALSLFIGNVFD